MTKKEQRLMVYSKFGGRCAYCGCELNGKFHVDEVEPVRRNYESVRIEGEWKWKRVLHSIEHPERLHIDNQFPACASCNINKHSMSLEEFRKLIAGFMKHLNEVNTQYKVAKRYGLFHETGNEVTFYFEIIEKP